METFAAGVNPPQMGGGRLAEMEHLDARAVRERLNSIMLAITTLDESCATPRMREIAAAARKALLEIAVLVTDDELEEHGKQPDTSLRQARRQIRAAG